MLSRMWLALVSNGELLTAAVALVLVVALARHRMSRQRHGERIDEGFETWIIIGALVGARIAAVVPEWSIYAAHPLDIVRINQGLSFYGALAGGAVAISVHSRIHRLDTPAVFDVLALFLPLGIALYRFGCLGYGYCGGNPAPFPLGIPLPGHVGTRFPSGLLEGALALGLFYVLLRLARRRWPSGSLALVFLSSYPLVRALIDPSRPQVGAWAWADEVLSIGLALTAMTVWVFRLVPFWTYRVLTRSDRGDQGSPTMVEPTEAAERAGDRPIDEKRACDG